MQNQAAQTKKSHKKPRSLRKRTASQVSQAVVTQRIDPARALPIDMDQSELNNLMLHIASGKERNPEAAFTKIYALAIDSVAETLKSTLKSFAASAASAPLPPFLANLMPGANADSFNRLADSIAEKIEQSRERIHMSFEQAGKTSLPSNSQSYNEFANLVRNSPILRTCFDALDPDASRSPLMPARLSDERVREIGEDLRHFVPEKTEHKPFKIDLNRRSGNIRFNLSSNAAEQPKKQPASRTEAAPANEESSSVVIAQTPSLAVDSAANESVASTTDVVDNTPAVTEELRIETLATKTNADDIPVSEPVAVTQVPEPVDVTPVSEPVEVTQVSEPIDVTQVSEPIDVTQEPIVPDETRETHGTPAFTITEELENAFFNAAVAQATGGAVNVQSLHDIQDAGADFARTFDGFTSMLTEFADQLSAAIIHEKLGQLPSLAESLRNDPRATQDDDLMEFVSFLDDTGEDAVSDAETIDNDELAAAFDQLLNQLD